MNEILASWAGTECLWLVDQLGRRPNKKQPEAARSREPLGSKLSASLCSRAFRGEEQDWEVWLREWSGA